MHKHITLLILILFLQSTAYADNSTLDNAMHSYQANNFQQAANLLLNNYSQLENFTLNEKLDAATIFLENSNIYREIYKSALPAQIAYLNTIKVENSVYTKLYLSAAYYQFGNINYSKELFDTIDASAITDDAETIHYQVLTELTRSRKENRGK